MSEEPVQKAAATLTEVGRSGLQMSGGIVSEEFLTNLRGVTGRRIFREMADNEPVIGGILLAFFQTIARLEWKFESGKDADSEEDQERDFCQECFDDMEDDWSDTLASIFSMATYGWSLLEIVYKKRDGENNDITRSSRFSDGKIGWRTWAERSQETLFRWESDKNGRLVAMHQTVFGDTAYGQSLMGGTFIIPLEKALLFRTTSTRGNPEGRSLLRNAYRPYFFKKRIEEIEAIGIERDLAGLPVAWLDPKYMSPLATSDEKALYATVQNIVTKIKRNEMEGVVYPLVYDERGNKIIDLELMNSGGQRQFDTDKIIGRKSQEIAMSVLADFLMLGHENVGTQSLGSSKIALWMMAVDAMAKAIAGVVNNYAVPRLLKLNGMSTENPPKLVYGAVEKEDLAALGTFLKAMADAGVIVPDRPLEEHIRTLVDLPPIDDETREETEAQVPLTPDEMAAYVAAGATPPATRPATPEEKQGLVPPQKIAPPKVPMKLPEQPAPKVPAVPAAKKPVPKK